MCACVRRNFIKIFVFISYNCNSSKDFKNKKRLIFLSNFSLRFLIRFEFLIFSIF